MDSSNDIKLVEAFSGEFWQAKMIQEILDYNQIPSFIKNELMGSIDPSLITPGGFNPIAVVVSSSNLAEAIKIIEEYNNAEPYEEPSGES